MSSSDPPSFARWRSQRKNHWRGLRTLRLWRAPVAFGTWSIFFGSSFSPCSTLWSDVMPALLRDRLFVVWTLLAAVTLLSAAIGGAIGPAWTISPAAITGAVL